MTGDIINLKNNYYIKIIESDDDLPVNSINLEKKLY